MRTPGAGPDCGGDARKVADADALAGRTLGDLVVGMPLTAMSVDVPPVGDTFMAKRWLNHTPATANTTIARAAAPMTP